MDGDIEVGDAVIADAEIVASGGLGYKVGEAEKEVCQRDDRCFIEGLNEVGRSQFEGPIPLQVDDHCERDGGLRGELDPEDFSESEHDSDEDSPSEEEHNMHKEKGTLSVFLLLDACAVEDDLAASRVEFLIGP